MSKSLIILGGGYTARFVLPLAERRYAQVLISSREPDRHLGQVPPDRRIRFDLMQRETWKNIPTDGDVLWCFPAEPLDLVQAFAAERNMASRRLVVLGSTSAYLTSRSSDSPPSWVDETAPIDTAKPRVQGEELLRTDCCAIILRVAGIYGPGRNPIDWIRKGRVSPSRKYVNLIHVEDLADICLITMERGMRGDAYNVSDGTPRTWKDICRIVQDRWGIQPSEEKGDASIGKRIATGKLLSLLGNAHTVLAHSDFYRSLERLQSGRPVT